MTSSNYKFKMAATYFLLEQSYAVFLLANAPKLPSRMARTKLILRKGEKGGKRRVLLSRAEREILAEKGRRPPSPVHHPFPEKKEMEEWVEAEGQLEGWAGHLHHCQPNSWSRWLWRLDHLSWARRSQSKGSSDLLWEAKPPEGIPPGW